MEKVAPQEQVNTTPVVGASARKRSTPIQKAVSKRANITQAQANAAVRRYLARVDQK
ncbi:MAG: hypothetical protein Q7T19_05505 [Caulobacter sp.]|nr:hypothetical protein [Caulobacter sp.]